MLWNIRHQDKINGELFMVRSLIWLHFTSCFPVHQWPHWDPVLSNSFLLVSHKLLSSTSFPPGFVTSKVPAAGSARCSQCVRCLLLPLMVVLTITIDSCSCLPSKRCFFLIAGMIALSWKHYVPCLSFHWDAGDAFRSGHHTTVYVGLWPWSKKE